MPLVLMERVDVGGDERRCCWCSQTSVRGRRVKSQDDDSDGDAR